MIELTFKKAIKEYFANVKFDLVLYSTPPITLVGAIEYVKKRDGAKIGQGCIINTASSVDHDCVLGDFVHVAVGAHLCGTVTIGNATWIGAGATVSNNVNICGECTIGAGAVVVKDITEPGTYIGVPARIKRLD